MMTLFAALSLLLASLLLEAVTGTLFGCAVTLPLYVLFYFSTVRHLPWTLLGAIAAGFVLDTLCGRAEPHLLKLWPAALLAGTLVRARLGNGGRWTALPAGAVMQIVLLSTQWRTAASTMDALAALLFETVAGAVLNLAVIWLIDNLAQRLKMERYAAAAVSRINQPPRKHRSAKISVRGGERS